MNQSLQELLQQAAQAGQQRQLAQARRFLEQALSLAPERAELHFHLAGICAELGDQGALRQALAQTLALDPSHAQALFHQAILHLREQQTEAAYQCLQRAVTAAPDFYPAWLKLGNLQRQRAQEEAAQHSYRQSIRLRPQAPEAWYNLGLTQEALGEYGDAIHSFEQALALKPGQTEILYHLGNCHYENFDLAAAAQAYTTLLEHMPDRASWWCNLGNVRLLQQDWAGAQAAYERAQALEPDSLEATGGLSYLALLQGELKHGYALYVQCHDRFPWKHTPLLQQRPVKWDGQIRSDQPLVVLTEQGLGDTIHYARYLPLLAARGQAFAIWNSFRPMHRLLGCLTGLEKLEIQAPPQAPEGAASVWLMQLPHWLGIDWENLPTEIPYFQVPPVAQERLAAGRRVGLVWASGRKVARNASWSYRQRSAGLQYFLPLLQQAGSDLHFYSFQVGLDEKQLEQAPSLPIHNLAPQLQDLYDTARWLQGMDLVISVDTAVAHLAGALGIPIWILLPHTPDGRWLLERRDSPWYPSARLFRQPAWQDWPGLFRELESAFAEWLQTAPEQQP